MSTFYKEAQMLVERLDNDEIFVPAALRGKETDCYVHINPNKGYGFIFKYKDDLVLGVDASGYYEGESEDEEQNRLNIFQYANSAVYHLEGWLVLFSHINEIEKLINANNWKFKPIKVEYPNIKNQPEYKLHPYYDFFAGTFVHKNTLRPWLWYEDHISF